MIGGMASMGLEIE